MWEGRGPWGRVRISPGNTHLETKRCTQKNSLAKKYKTGFQHVWVTTATATAATAAATATTTTTATTVATTAATATTAAAATTTTTTATATTRKMEFCFRT